MNPICLHFDDVTRNFVWTGEVKGNANLLQYWPTPQPVLVPVAPSDVAIPGMPILGPPADAGLGAISPKLTFSNFYSWQLNMSTSIAVFRGAFNSVRSYASKYEIRRLMTANPTDWIQTPSQERRRLCSTPIWMPYLRIHRGCFRSSSHVTTARFSILAYTEAI